MQLTQKTIDFLLVIRDNKGQITKGDQKMYGSVAYYVMTNYLSSIGLIYCNGFNEKNQKRWVFTDTGEKIAEHLYQIRKIYYDSSVNTRRNSKNIQGNMKS